MTTLPQVKQDDASEGQWDVLCEQGRIAASNMDEGRWTLGELASCVEKTYREDRIGDFAKEVNVPKKRVAQYRAVYKFWSPAWEKSKRLDFLETRPNLSYTHYLTALRLKEFEAALTWIDTVSENGWTTDEAAYHLAERLGKPVKAETLMHSTVLILGAPQSSQSCVLQIEVYLDEQAALAEIFRKLVGHSVQMIVKELKS